MPLAEGGRMRPLHPHLDPPPSRGRKYCGSFDKLSHQVPPSRGRLGAIRSGGGASLAAKGLHSERCLKAFASCGIVTAEGTEKLLSCGVSLFKVLRVLQDIALKIQLAVE